MSIEKALLSAIKDGDGNRQRECFGRLFDETKDRLLFIALSILRNRDDAEDVVSETFLSVMRNPRSLFAVDDIGPYLNVSVKNAAYKRLGKTEFMVEYDDEVSSKADGMDPSAACGNEEIYEWLLGLLGKKDADLAILYFGYGFTSEELSRQMGTKESVIYGRLNRAMAKMRKSAFKGKDKSWHQKKK